MWTMWRTTRDGPIKRGLAVGMFRQLALFRGPSSASTGIKSDEMPRAMNDPAPALNEPAPNESCLVCCESYTSKKRKRVKCGYCEFDACVICHEKYLLASNEDPHCMSCKKAWSKPCMDDNFNRAFTLGRYKEHREAVLLEREKAMIPATQVPFQNYKAEKTLVATVAEREKDIATMKRKIRELTEKNNWDNTRAYRIRRSNYEDDGMVQPGTGGPERAKANAAPVYIRKCPVEVCRGYLSASKFVCGICDVKVCKECHEILPTEGEHRCKDDDVATAKLIMKDTKPCPKCATPIFKIGGCNQMWCTQCMTAFAWSSGKIETGTIHNPHFYDWMRMQGREVPRNPLDMPCAGDHVSIYEMDRVLRRADAVPKDRVDAIRFMHRQIVHVRATMLGPLQNRQRYAPQNNLDLRLKYLAGEMNDDAFKRQLQQREKQRQKENDLIQAYDMFVVAGNDIIRKVLQQGFTHARADEVLTELTALAQYADKCLLDISRRYNSVTYKISTE